MKATEKNIIENNKLIAEFMGAKMLVTNYYGINIIEFPDKTTKDLHGLKYNSSWDWLMPVVEKIEKMGYIVVIVTHKTEIYKEEDYPNIAWVMMAPGGKINTTYLSVVRFILSYNNNTL